MSRALWWTGVGTRDIEQLAQDLEHLLLNSAPRVRLDQFVPKTIP